MRVFSTDDLNRLSREAALMRIALCLSSLSNLTTVNKSSALDFFGMMYYLWLFVSTCYAISWSVRQLETRHTDDRDITININAESAALKQNWTINLTALITGLACIVYMPTHASGFLSALLIVTLAHMIHASFMFRVKESVSYKLAALTSKEVPPSENNSVSSSTTLTLPCSLSTK